MDCLPSVSDDVITNELDAYGATVHCSESLTQLGESSETAPHANECVSPDDTLQRSCALYLLTLKEKYKLTQTAVDFVVSQTKDTIQTVIDNLHQSVHDSICSGNQPNFDHILKVHQIRTVALRPSTSSQSILRTIWVLWYVCKP